MKYLRIIIPLYLLLLIIFASACSAFSPEPTPTLTNTATFTPIPPTATFTRIPPTATFTLIPPTATNTPVLATDTPALPPGPDVMTGQWYGRDVTDAFRMEFEINRHDGQIAFNIITGVWEGRCKYAAADVRFIPLPEPLPIDQDGYFGNGF